MYAHVVQRSCAPARAASRPRRARCKIRHQCSSCAPRHRYVLCRPVATWGPGAVSMHRPCALARSDEDTSSSTDARKATPLAVQQHSPVNKCRGCWATVAKWDTSPLFAAPVGPTGPSKSRTGHWRQVEPWTLSAASIVRWYHRYWCGRSILPWSTVYKNRTTASLSQKQGEINRATWTLRPSTTCWANWHAHHSKHRRHARRIGALCAVHREERPRCYQGVAGDDINDGKQRAVETTYQSPASGLAASPTSTIPSVSVTRRQGTDEKTTPSTGWSAVWRSVIPNSLPHCQSVWDQAEQPGQDNIATRRRRSLRRKDVRSSFLGSVNFVREFIFPCWRNSSNLYTNSLIPALIWPILSGPHRPTRPSGK